MAVPASLLVSSGLCVGASACVSSGLAFCATFAVSLLFVARVLSPELVDGVLGLVGACAPQEARLARAAVVSAYLNIEADARRLRDAARALPVLAHIYARAEERARRGHAFVTDGVDGLKRRARAKWSDLTDVTIAALCWLRLTAGVINLTATVLFPVALEEAKNRAPSVLRWRGVKGIRSPLNEESEEAVVSSSSCSKPDTALLVGWIAVILMYCTHVLVLSAVTSGVTSFAACFACFAALCGFAIVEAERIYLWGSYDIDTRANPRRRVGNAGKAGGTMETDVRDAWQSLCWEIIFTYFSDACFLCVALGPRPVALAFLAVCNLATLKVARQVYLTADDGEEANGPAHGVDGDVSKWQRAAMAVLAMDSAKVLAIYLVLDFYLGALSFVCLCITTAFSLDKEVCLSDVHASGDDNGEGADLARIDVAGDAEGSESSDDVSAEDSSTIAASEHEEEGSATQEHCDESSSEEQRQEEPDYSSSSSVDDWSLVVVDPVTPNKVNGGTTRNFRPWPRIYMGRRV